MVLGCFGFLFPTRALMVSRMFWVLVSDARPPMLEVGHGLHDCPRPNIGGRALKRTPLKSWEEYAKIGARGPESTRHKARVGKNTSETTSWKEYTKFGARGPRSTRHKEHL